MKITYLERFYDDGKGTQVVGRLQSGELIFKTSKYFEEDTPVKTQSIQIKKDTYDIQFLIGMFGTVEHSFFS